PLTVLAFAIASSTAALFFGGGWRESVGATAIGVTIGTVALLGGGNRQVARLLPVVSGLLASTLAHALATQLQPMFPLLATLAGLILLIPGLGLTVAMSELAHNHLVSGTARLTGASITFLQLGFGAAIGWKISPGWFGEIPIAPPVPLATWMIWAVLPVTAFAFVILFRAHPRDYVAILLGSIAAYAGSRFGSERFGPEIGMAFGAWVLGCTSTILARRRRRPAAIALVPGLLLLVPGALGIRSLQALIRNDVPLGIETAFTMILIAVALVTGLFLANLTLRPRAL
ncbi:MAG: threonine/serine exporter family protein, partial [Planctomycetes bacterium]|nr:threonine/serine exporter family protein [Planctomycetota bacterium]